ncbi:MAG: hypothetical protein HPY82_08775 [Gammaproteobacteria bacterium]|nr:hypothetical protein [Gammaproteobacteria bacterium]
MDVVSIGVILFVLAASLFASRHASGWERDRWLKSVGYSLLSVAALVLIGLINKRIYLVLIVLYAVLFWQLERAVKSRFGHLWFSLFVGASGVIPIAIYQLFFL